MKRHKNIYGFTLIIIAFILFGIKNILLNFGIKSTILMNTIIFLSGLAGMNGVIIIIEKEKNNEENNQ